MIGIKQFSFIVLIILIVFSMSAVSATNETVADDSSGNNVSLENATADDTNDVSAIENSGDSNFSDVESISEELPQLEVSIKSDDDSSANPYIDISIDYKDYSLNINNKNYFFTFNQDFKNNPTNINDDKLLNLATFAKKNRLFLNVNFLNVSNKDFGLYAPANMFTYIWSIFWSFIDSIF